MKGETNVAFGLETDIEKEQKADQKTIVGVSISYFSNIWNKCYKNKLLITFNLIWFNI